MLIDKILELLKENNYEPIEIVFDHYDLAIKEKHFGCFAVLDKVNSVVFILNKQYADFYETDDHVVLLIFDGKEFEKRLYGKQKS